VINSYRLTAGAEDKPKIDERLPAYTWGEKEASIMKMGSPLWKLRYKTRRNPWLILVPVLLFILLLAGSCALIGGEEEAVTKTAGQSVVDRWVYGGFDFAGTKAYFTHGRVNAYNAVNGF
jgi:hypothetical protein